MESHGAYDVAEGKIVLLVSAAFVGSWAMGSYNLSSQWLAVR